MSGTDGLATVRTRGAKPCSGRYFASFDIRWTPAPPTGGKLYDTIKARPRRLLLGADQGTPCACGTCGSVAITRASYLNAEPHCTTVPLLAAFEGFRESRREALS